MGEADLTGGSRGGPRPTPLQAHTDGQGRFKGRAEGAWVTDDLANGLLTPRHHPQGAPEAIEGHRGATPPFKQERRKPPKLCHCGARRAWARLGATYVPHDYSSAALCVDPPKNAVSTLEGQMQSSRPPSGPVRNPCTAPGGMKTKVPGPTPSAGAEPV